MSYYSENLTILVAKIESVPGTMETLDNDDFDFKVFNPTVTINVEPDDEAAKYANSGHGEDVSIMGMQYGTIGFGVKLAKGASSLVAPKWSKFLEGCGAMPYTGNGGLSWVPNKAYDEKTLTIWLYKIQRGQASPKAVCFKYAGCSGKVTIGGEGAGKPVMLNFTFDGTLKDVDFNVSTLPEINNVDETCYERLLSSNVAIDGLQRLVDTFNLDTGNENSMLKNFAETTGIQQFGITKRSPRFTCNPLMVGATGTVKTDYEYLYGSTTGCPTTPTIVVTTSHFSLTMPKCQLLSLTPGGRDGLSMMDQTWKCLPNGYTGSVVDGDLPYDTTWELKQL